MYVADLLVLLALLGLLVMRLLVMRFLVMLLGPSHGHRGFSLGLLSSLAVQDHLVRTAKQKKKVSAC
jgi:hypothetical protein